MKFNDEATKKAAWAVIEREAIKRGQVHLTDHAHRAAFFAGWEAHRDALKKAEKYLGGTR